MKQLISKGGEKARKTLQERGVREELVMYFM